MDELIRAAQGMVEPTWEIAQIRARGDDPTQYLAQVSGHGIDQVLRSNGDHTAGDEVLLLRKPHSSAPFIAGASPVSASSLVVPATNQDGSDITVSDIIGLQLDPRFRQEVPAGAVDGSNATFHLTVTPVPGSVVVYLNGLDVTADVSVHGRTLVLPDAPFDGEGVYVDYLEARRLT